MKTLKILDWPAKRFYGETHHFYRWKRELLNHGFKVEIYSNHNDNRLREADYLLIHSRYFEDGWQNIYKRSAKNEAGLIAFLIKMKATAGKLIWFDAADSTGSSDFPIISLVDVFLKKQLLKDMNYYVASAETKDLRIWMNNKSANHQPVTFEPCPVTQLHKLKIGWNLGYNDYRYFGYKMSRLSNYLSYQSYPPQFTSVQRNRKYDITFRGTIHSDNGTKYKISDQRNHVLRLLENLKLNIATGKNVSKAKYWRELRNSKLSISPFGWGEICYRDFEILITGSLLVKPLMNHLITFPDVYIPDHTYIPVPWNLLGLEQLLEQLIDNYPKYAAIAKNGQELYKNQMNDAEGFINSLKRNIS